MKKKILSVVLLATMITASLVIAGCSCSSKNSTNNTTNATNQTANASTNNTNNAAANQAQPANATIVGNYKLIEKTDDGVILNEAQISAKGDAKTMEVKADGTAVVKEADGDIDNYKYDADKFIKIDKDGDVYGYSYDSNNNTLKLIKGDEIKVYQRV